MTTKLSPTKSILVVEDDRALRGALVAILELEGFRVIEAQNGEDGLRRVIEERPGLVFADVMYNGGVMDGYDLVEAMRRHGFKDPAHITTALSGPEVEERAKRAGAQSLVRKPYDFEHIFRLAREAVPFEKVPYS